MTDTNPLIDPLDLIPAEDLIPIGQEDIKKEEKIALYSRSMAYSTSLGLVNPFVSFIALTMGASAGILAWIQAIANLLRQFLDPIFGRLSDMVKRRIPFIVISTITWIVPYAFLFFINSPAYIILIAAIVNILTSLGNPAWLALQNELFPAKVRGKLTGRVTWFGSLGSMLATLFTGIILTYAFGDINYQKYILIPVSIGLFISIIAVIPFRRIEEPLLKEGVIVEKTNLSFKSTVKLIWINKPFVKFTFLYSLFGIFWTFSWPLFSIKQVNILNASAVEVAALEIIFSGTSLIFILFGAKIADKIGRTKLIFINRFCLFLFPLGYLFASEVWHLYLVHFFVSSLFSFGIAGVNAYILDIVPPKQSGLYIGVFSMITGVFYFIGTLSGGYMVEILQNWYSEEVALNIALIVAIVTRFIISFLFLTLKDVQTFSPLNFRKNKSK